ncbi:MAG: alanine dehydrogenase [Mariprofundus sp.]|nr:alanine dehydrogenase [Mariprofundus sp.]
MNIGLPKEIKNYEHRVALTPKGVKTLIADGHQVIIETNAGLDSGFEDQLYLQAGGLIVENPADAWAAELVVKVKEPQVQEYGYLRSDLTLFTYLHLAADALLADELLKKGVCAIAYETVQLQDGSLPLLAPMSRVAGRVAVQLGAHFLQKENGTEYSGKGVLLGGVDGVAAARAVILGAGTVGLNAADALIGLGAKVVMLEKNSNYLERLKAQLDQRIELQLFSEQALDRLLPTCDLLIGAALVPGEHAPRLLMRAELRRMASGSLFVDVSIDQGGVSETSRVSSFDAPIYRQEGVLHCCLPNLPSAVARTSTHALTSVTLAYIQRLAGGVALACRTDSALAAGVNVCAGNIIHAGVKKSLR